MVVHHGYPRRKTRRQCAIDAASPKSRRPRRRTGRAGRHPGFARRRRLRLRHDCATRGDGARRRPRPSRLFPRHGAFGGGPVRAHERGTRRRGAARRPKATGLPTRIRSLSTALGGDASESADSGRLAGRRPQGDPIAAGKLDPAGELELHQRDAHLSRRGFGGAGEIVERDRRGPEQRDDAVARRVEAVDGDIGAAPSPRRVRRPGLFAAWPPDRRRAAPARPRAARRRRRLLPALRTGRPAASARARSRRRRPRCRSSRPASGGRSSPRRAGRAASRAWRTPGGSGRGRSGR